MSEAKKNIDDAFRRYYRPLCLYAMHYLHNMDLVEDIVQDCFAELWEKLSTHKDISNVKSYLYMMVRNHCYDTLKKENFTDYNLSPFDLEDILTDEECEERSLIEVRLWSAIDSLPERCREVFLLSKRDGLKYKEIAEKLDISINTVENQVSKALRLLKESSKKIYYFFFS